MSDNKPKKLLIIYILHILKEHSDEEHRLSTQQIITLLKSEYDMNADRKSIKRNIMNLIAAGYDIIYEEKPRINQNGEKDTVCTDWCLQSEFVDAELRLLIDSLLFFRNIPNSQRKKLIDKICNLSSKYFKPTVRHIHSISERLPVTNSLFWVIEKLDEAIANSRQVEFYYNSYGTDKKLHIRRDEDGNPKLHKVSPYQIVVANSRYYLICNNSNHNNIIHYRLDRISNIDLTDTPIKPLEQVTGQKNGIDLPKHMAEHIYMFAGKSERVTFSLNKNMVGDVLDWFGKDIEFCDETEDTVTATVIVNLEAMRKWALQYAVHITIHSPKKLVEDVREDLNVALNRYSQR